jgi:hypothetical protein
MQMLLTGVKGKLLRKGDTIDIKRKLISFFACFFFKFVIHQWVNLAYKSLHCARVIIPIPLLPALPALNVIFEPLFPQYP